MIRHTTAQRIGVSIVCVPVALFAAVAAAVNAVDGRTGDTVGLLALVAWLVALMALRWTRFVVADDVGLTFRNWVRTNRLPWSDIMRIDVRSLFQPRYGGWAAVAHRRRGSPITLRATGRGG